MDDLPPLCGSDAELSSDELPNLEHSEGEDCGAGSSETLR
jgi:hypothetical protein